MCELNWVLCPCLYLEGGELALHTVGSHLQLG